MDEIFTDKLKAHWDRNKFLCVGLDPQIDKLPQIVRKSFTTISEQIFEFNKAIIDVTSEYVCAFKPNSSFYEMHGAEGFSVLQKTIAYIHKYYPSIPVILDAKRGDIGNSNLGYAISAFDILKADAITIHSYLGQEAVQPLLERKDKGIILLVKTSNKGSFEFQDLIIEENGIKMPLYKKIALNISEKWNSYGNCAIVVGATYPAELKAVRALVGDMPILIPGIGVQGGDLQTTVSAGKDSKNQGMIINVARSVLFASSDIDYAQAAKSEAQRLYQQIISFL